MTLGLYYPYAITEIRSYYLNNLYLGENHFEYHGEPKNLLMLILKVGILISILMLLPNAILTKAEGLWTFKTFINTFFISIFTSFLSISKASYQLRNTTYRGKPFYFDKRGKTEVFFKTIGLVYVLVYSKFILLPFVILLNRKIFYKHVYYDQWKLNCFGSIMIGVFPIGFSAFICFVGWLLLFNNYILSLFVENGLPLFFLVSIFPLLGISIIVGVHYFNEFMINTTMIGKAKFRVTTTFIGNLKFSFFLFISLIGSFGFLSIFFDHFYFVYTFNNLKLVGDIGPASKGIEKVEPDLGSQSVDLMTEILELFCD